MITLNRFSTLVFSIILFSSTLHSQYTLTDADVVVTDGIIQSCSYNFSEQEISIPNSLDGQTVIGIADKDSVNGVFQNRGITAVYFPTTLEHIGDYAFSGNQIDHVSLENLPLVSIGNYAFYGNNLEFLDLFSLPLITIGDYAFSENNLRDLSLYDLQLVSIGNYAFSGNQEEYTNCNLEINQDLMSIGMYAFQYVNFNQASISNCPIDSIDSYAFCNTSGAINLENVNSLKVIGEYAFQGSSVSISSTSLDSIGPYALYESYAWLDCPAIRYIGEYGCYGSHYSMISQFKELEYIGNYAFKSYEPVDLDLRGLTKLTYIGEGAFYCEYPYPGSGIPYLYLPSAGLDGYNYRWTNGSGNYGIGGTKVYLQDGLSATLEPVYSLTFNVGDGTQPVNNATVSILGNYEFNMFTQEMAYIGSTNASGVCIFNEVLADDEISYKIITDNYPEYNGTVSIVDSDVEENVILSIIKYDVSFTITDGTDPIQGATVTLSGYDPITTDAEGKATVTEVVPEENITYTIEADDYNQGSGTVTVNDYDVDLNVTLELTKYTVTFSVTDGTNPIEEAVVTLSSSAKATDASGIIEFPEIAPEEGIAYTVIANGYESNAGTVSVVDQDVTIDIVLTSTVGISNLRSKSILIYPNPAKDILYIELGDNELPDGYRLTIINQIGAIVYNQQVKKSKQEIDLSNWSGYGLFYLQVIDSGGEVIGAKKIILH